MHTELYKFVILDIIDLWRIGPMVKHFKVLKYYNQDCLKIFFLLSTRPMVI